MNKQTLEKEVDEYNEIVKKIQTINQTQTELEQQRLIKLGRIQFLQETVAKEEKPSESFSKNSKSK